MPDRDRRSHEVSTQIHYRLVEELAASRAQYQELVESIPEIVLELDREGRLSFLNPAWRVKLGYSLEESIGRELAGFVHREDLGNFHLARSEGREENAAAYRLQDVFRLRTATGETRWFAWAGGISSATSTTGLLIDATDQVRADELQRVLHKELLSQNLVLERQSNRIKNLFDHLSEGVFLLDSGFRIIHVNLAAKARLGFPSGADDGQDFFTLLAAAGVGDLPPDILDGESGGFEAEIVDRTDEHRFLSFSFRQILASAKERPYLLVVLRDITAERKVAAEKQRFLDNFSHELRTPLTSIYGFTQTLLDTEDIPADQQRRFLTIIQRQSQRLRRLIDGVLQLSETNVEQGEIVTEAVELRPLLERMREEFAPVVAEKGQRLLLEIGDVTPRVTWNRKHLETAVSNLLSNAIKYSGEDATILLRAVEDDEELRIEVLDEGIGVPPGDRWKIFQRFFRTSISRETEGGTGLGLAISRETMQLLGGDVRYAPREGQGSCFSVVMPLRTAPRT
jgi:two-component system phosphate regulon sensor histidine kinase PhoR